MLIVCIALGCEGVPVLDGVSSQEANEAVAALDREGVPARRIDAANARGEGGTAAVSVASGDVARAVDVLRANGIPRSEQAGFDAVLGERPVVPSQDEEHARLLQATAGELAHSIETMDGVAMARVHLAAPESTVAALDPAPSTLSHARASVVIRLARDGTAFDPEPVQRLVAGAVVDLRPEDVTVLVLPRRTPLSARPPAFVWFGPIAVARGSAGTVRAVASIAIVLVMLAAALMLRQAWPHRRG